MSSKPTEKIVKNYREVVDSLWERKGFIPASFELPFDVQKLASASKPGVQCVFQEFL